jgi:repressor LexA
MISDRLKLLRKNLVITQKEFSDLIGVSRQSYNHYEMNNREMSLGTLANIITKTRCNAMWLLTGDGSMFITDKEDTSDPSNQILHIESDIAAGEPVEATGRRLDSIKIGYSLIQNVNDYYCFSVNGQSMEPDIQNQDLVIIKKDNDWNDKENEVCAVRIDGDITLKRISHDYKRKMIILASDNKKFTPIVVDPKHTDAFMLGCLYMVIRRVE